MGFRFSNQQVVVFRRAIIIILAVTDDRSITSLNKSQSNIGVTLNNSGHFSLFESLRSRLLAVNGHLDVLANELLTQELLGIRPERSLAGIGRLGLANTAKAELFLLTGLVPNKESISVQHTTDNVVLRGPASRALGSDQTSEETLSAILRGLLRMTEGSHMRAQQGGVVIMASRQTGLKQELGNVSIGMKNSRDKLALRCNTQ